MQVNIGLDSGKRQEVANQLAKLLADTYLLYVKTQNFHWNVTGPHFHSLHKMFEEQYNELADAVDTIAERIRALGFTSPASFAEFLKLATLKEAVGVTAASAMIDELLADHEAIIRHGRAVFAVADQAEDEGTADLIVGRLREHEKTAWMLRSSKL